MPNRNSHVGQEHGDGNSDWVIGWDSVHPSPDGIHFLAERFANAVVNLVKK